MDLGYWTSIMSLGVSLVALILSSLLAWRQVRSTRASNDTIVAVDWMSRQLISDSFLESEAYVLDRLTAEHTPERGVSGLPEPARHHVHRVGRYYASLGHLTVFGAIEERLILSIIHYRLRAAWYVLEPYVRAERELRGAPFFNFFEHIAVRASEVNTSDLLKKLRLRQFPIATVEGRGFPGEGRPISYPKLHS